MRLKRLDSVLLLAVYSGKDIIGATATKYGLVMTVGPTTLEGGERTGHVGRAPNSVTRSVAGTSESTQLKDNKLCDERNGQEVLNG